MMGPCPVQSTANAEILTGVIPYLLSRIRPTEFEMQVKELGLNPQDYVSSATLGSWCKRNRDHFLEWLLEGGVDHLHARCEGSPGTCKHILRTMQT